VVGDIVKVALGDIVPADLLVLKCEGIKVRFYIYCGFYFVVLLSHDQVDNSSLTGECEPLERSEKGDKENPMETKNLMFNSTQVVEGKGVGMVIRIGIHA
jgi:sodium/potassium-transporting ATPase subunit alpha